jgi:hypothetical protein
MIVLLDSSAKYAEAARHRWPQVEFGQLRTPLTRRKRDDSRVYALDNGCFAKFNRNTWLRMVAEASNPADLATFVALPDCVGSARRTAEMFDLFCNDTLTCQRALVLQDGIGDHEIRWSKIAAVFVGGSDSFKSSDEAFQACRAAKALGKWVHVGRVNTSRRLRDWIGLADSIDGSGISQYDHMLDDVCREIMGEHDGGLFGKVDAEAVLAE